jgi:hypothetical protein
MPAFAFDAFLSYSTLTQYWLARRIEAFLEGRHATPGGERSRSFAADDGKGDCAGSHAAAA